MNHLYAKLFGLLSLGLMVTLTYGSPKRMTANKFSSVSTALPTAGYEVSPRKPWIKKVNGAFAVNLKKFDLNPEGAVAQFNRWLGLNADYHFEKTREVKDKRGMTHIVFQEYYKGIKVNASQVLLHAKNGKAVFFNGKIRLLHHVETTTGISSDQALHIAKEQLGVTHLIHHYPVEKVFTLTRASRTKKNVLAYKVRLESYAPFVMRKVYVDARTGAVLWMENLIKNIDTPGTGETYYNGTQDITCDSFDGGYRLRETDRNIHTLNAATATTTGEDYYFVDAEDYVSPTTDFVDTISGEPGNPALDVHWGMETTIDFYRNKLNRDSYDDQGGLIVNYVNPSDSVLNAIGAGMAGMPNNAFAIGAPFNYMCYGLGDGQLLGPVVGLDVEGHEFTHIVVSHNDAGGLGGFGMAAALNESFADIFGTSIEFYSGVDPNWTIGEDVTLTFPDMRDMANPKNPTGLSHQPDTYLGQFWQEPGDFFSFDPHIDGGVQNYWFYLLSEGGSGTNDNGDAYDVQGIGIDKAEQIAYRNMMHYLTQDADYMVTYNGSLQAAADLYGLSSSEYTAVAEAWYAVGIGDDPHKFCDAHHDFTAPSGTFDDGSGNQDYVNNTHCTWLIHPADVDSIELIFLQFNTELNADSVVVYDGPDTNSPVLGAFTGDNLPDPVVGTSGSMLVEFFTNQSVTKSGWKVHYETEDLGVANRNFDRQLKLFPNPSHGTFTVHSGLSEAAEFQLYDIFGRRVGESESLKPGDNTIDRSGLAPGIYFARIHSGKLTSTKKVIVK